MSTTVTVKQQVGIRRAVVARCAFFCLSLIGATAHAGPPPGSITFSPGGASIPTLGGAMLVLLALLLAFIAVVSMRRRLGGGIPLVAGALALASLLSAGGGVELIRKAQAGMTPIIPIINAGDFTKPVAANTTSLFENQFGAPLTVIDVTLPGGCPASVLSQPDACSVNRVLGNSDQCVIDCTVVVISDARLKADIHPIGETSNGLPLYRFRYKTGSQNYIGVMAQDVLWHTPAAVHLMPNGYLAVDYAALDTQMLPVD